MGEDMVQWAQVSPIGVGDGPGGDLTAGAQPPPGLPDPRLKKPRSRPNRGRKRRYIGPYLETPPWDMLRETGYPIPPDLEPPLPHVPPQWRAGYRADKWRAGVFAKYGDMCHLCGHGGADSADHLIPLSKWGNQPYDVRLSRPAHGIAGCKVCGLKCNSSRGNRAFALQISQYKPVVGL